MNSPKELVLKKEDFIDYSMLGKKKTCCGVTKKGDQCKNRLYKDYKYCSLHYKQFSLEKPDECPVCMESLENVNIPLKCGHWIHHECILQWKEDTCPMCRTEIKFTKADRLKKRKIHRKKEGNNEIFLPPAIMELIESIISGVPEQERQSFILGLLQIDIEGNSILIGVDGDDNEEFSMSDIEDFPDAIIY